MDRKLKTQPQPAVSNTSTTLYELRRANEQSYINKRDAALNEYLAGANPIIAALQSEAKALREIAPKIEPLLERTLTEFAPSNFDAPGVKKAIADLHLCCRAGLRTLKEFPRAIDKLIFRMSAYQPSHFIYCSPATQLGIDRREADCLLNRSTGFDSVPDQLEKLKAGIKEAIAFAATRPVFTPLPRSVGTLQPKEEEHKIEDVNLD